MYSGTGGGGLIVLKSVSAASYAADMSMREPSSVAASMATYNNEDVVRFASRMPPDNSRVVGDPASLSVRSVELVTEEEYLRSCEATA